MKKMKKLLAVVAVITLFASTCIIGSAATRGSVDVIDCPNGCAGSIATTYSHNVVAGGTQTHSVLVDGTLQECTITMKAHEIRYVCNKCGASRGSRTYEEYTHSISHN